VEEERSSPTYGTDAPLSPIRWYSRSAFEGFIAAAGEQRTRLKATIADAEERSGADLRRTMDGAGAPGVRARFDLAGRRVGPRDPQTDERPDASTSTTTTLPLVEVQRVVVELSETTRQLETTEGDLAARKDELADIRAALTRTEADLESNRAEFVKVQARVRSRAAAVYVQSGSRPLVPSVISNRQHLESGETYASAANAVDNALVDRLGEVRDALLRDRDERNSTRDELEQSIAELETLRDRLTALKTEQQALLDRWGAVPVMGTASLSAEQITAWFASTKIAPRLPPGLAVDDLARFDIEEGALAGAKGDVAFAQSIVETGSFTEFEGYNFSGIGVCDSCTGGYLFDAAKDGVRAQMQLLRS
jgi:hypothetical protein